MLGTWTRASIEADDGVTKVTPRLVIASDKEGSDLMVGAASNPPGFAEKLSFAVHRIVSSEKNAMVIDVDGKQVEVDCVVEGNTLKITCKQRLPAGSHLKAYDISGAWTRLKR